MESWRPDCSAQTAGRIWATRNHIAHGYAFVSQDLIQETIRFNLPDFERTLRSELDKLDTPD